MVNFVADQAEGLRKILGQGGLQVITVMSGQRRDGKTAAVSNLAVAIARLGREVLVLDQDSGGRGVCAMLGVEPKGDLFEVVSRRAALADIILTTPDGVQVLPMGGSFEQLARLSAPQQEILEQAFATLQRTADVILVDSPNGCDPASLPPGLAGAEIVVLMSPSAESIKQGYVLVKKLAQDFGKRRFRLLMNRVTNPEEARVIAANFAQTAESYLGVAADYVGFVPHDERLARAGSLRKSVVDAFPIAESTVQFRRLADGLLRWPRAVELGELGGFMGNLLQGRRLLGACKRA